MPRRTAPTALRLHRGPMPAWNEPIHRLPQPPIPSLAPNRPLPKISIAITYSLPPASSRSSSPSSSGSKEVKAPWVRSRDFAAAAQDGAIWSPIKPPQPVASLSSPKY
ncbi:hypothetical protein FRB94_005256 [Tulasnella sp. JGI-2019a]|nr:hypothetical protein FRB94_005256 [Tulasnella sp. JGI-2019a]KAG9016208.1 hypothetical protein FRB93_011682 [Tulasnella sp. JGI-2019a]KAG9036481.1 hypothetical protein FRB95_008779 [Tulasnella sp. JGI-2019a]